MSNTGTSQIDSLIQANLFKDLYKTIEHAEMFDYMNILFKNILK